MKRIIECVPNYSEGRDRGVIDAIVAAIGAVEGVKVLDVDPGEATNRTVVTFVGEPEAVVEAAFKGIRPAVVALIAAPLFKMAKSANISWVTALIPITAALLIWLGHVNPVWVILATIIITLCSIWLSSYRSSK